MKRICYLLFCLSLGLFCAASAFAQAGTEAAADPYTVSNEMIQVLVSNLSNIYPISSLKNGFLTPAEALYSDVGPDTMVRTETADGLRNILLIANADGIHDHSAFYGIDEAYPTDFQFSMDVEVGDIYPESQGGCFIGFTNDGLTKLADAGSAVTVALTVDGKKAELYVKTAEENTGVRIPITDSQRRTYKLSILHLTGHTYVLLNGNYAGQFYDGKKGSLRLIYGATLYTEGDTAFCYFDNLAVRKVNPQ